LLGALSAAPHAAAQDDPAFTAWRAGFIARAQAAGRTPAALDALFADIAPDPTVLELDRRQTRFTQPLWAYLEARLSPARIERGQALLSEHAALLAALEARYGVPAPILIAIWGMESRYGEAELSYDARRSVATLAYAGRRKREFELQLLALARMIDEGDAPAEGLRSSWDGGLGQPQFMPRSFVSDAVDWNGDGARDLWGDSADALASIGAYLQARGWRRGAPTLREAGAGDADHVGRVLRPAGAAGPALIAYPNFDVLFRYNGVERYGLATALLARAIAGEAPLQTDWSRPADALTREETMEAQALLTHFGHDAGNADGVYGERTWLAMNSYARARALSPLTYPTRALLENLRQRAAAGVAE